MWIPYLDCCSEAVFTIGYLLKGCFGNASCHDFFPHPYPEVTRQAKFSGFSPASLYVILCIWSVLKLLNCLIQAYRQIWNWISIGKSLNYLACCSVTEWLSCCYLHRPGEAEMEKHSHGWAGGTRSWNYRVLLLTFAAYSCSHHNLPSPLVLTPLGQGGAPTSSLPLSGGSTTEALWALQIKTAINECLLVRAKWRGSTLSHAIVRCFSVPQLMSLFEIGVKRK